MSYPTRKREKSGLAKQAEKNLQIQSEVGDDIIFGRGMHSKPKGGGGEPKSKKPKYKVNDRVFIIGRVLDDMSLELRDQEFRGRVRGVEPSTDGKSYLYDIIYSDSNAPDDEQEESKVFSDNSEGSAGGDAASSKKRPKKKERVVMLPSKAFTNTMTANQNTPILTHSESKCYCGIDESTPIPAQALLSEDERPIVALEEEPTFWYDENGEEVALGMRGDDTEDDAAKNLTGETRNNDLALNQFSRICRIIMTCKQYGTDADGNFARNDAFKFLTEIQESLTDDKFVVSTVAVKQFKTFLNEFHKLEETGQLPTDLTKPGEGISAKDPLQVGQDCSWLPFVGKYVAGVVNTELPPKERVQCLKCKW